MSAIIALSPPTKALNTDSIWLKLQSSEVAVANSYLRMSTTGANSVGQAITITFGGTSVVFTIAASPDGSGTQIPQRVAQTAEVYAGELAEAISQNEIITNNFTVYAMEISSVWYCYLMAKDRSALAMSFVEDIANLVATTYSSTGIFMQENLRAMVEVYNDTGSASTDTSLGQQHATYGLDRMALLDLSSHFADMDPAPPWTGSLATFHVSAATSMMRKWFFRYADKYGSPAVAEGMQKATGGVVFFGSHSADALTDYATAAIKHITTQSDGMLFWKPIAINQPDWTYFYCTDTRADYNYSLKIYWTDGSSNVYSNPTAFNMATDTLYSITSGALQMAVEDKATTEAKDPLRFEFSIIDGADTYYFTRRYKIDPSCQPWGHQLLYTNGVGGMDSVWLSGKVTEVQTTSAEYAQKTRTNSWILQDADTLSYNQLLSLSWTTSTGWYPDSHYLDHLRQLPLAKKAWIIDVANARFLPVHIQPGELQTNEDDQDLHALELTITAAWIDSNSNL